MNRYLPNISVRRGMLLIYSVTLGNVRGGPLPYRDTPPSPLPPHHVETHEGGECRDTEVSPRTALQVIKSLKTTKSDFKTSGIGHLAGAMSSIQTLKQSPLL